MPRGVYSRSESRIRRITQENNQLSLEMRGLRRSLEKRDLELRASEARTKFAEEEISDAEQFTLLRTNLQSLAEARKIMSQSDQMSPQVIATLDKEIAAHIECLARLRATAFKSICSKVPNILVPMLPIPELEAVAG